MSNILIIRVLICIFFSLFPDRCKLVLLEANLFQLCLEYLELYQDDVAVVTSICGVIESLASSGMKRKGGREGGEGRGGREGRGGEGRDGRDNKEVKRTTEHKIIFISSCFHYCPIVCYFSLSLCPN